MARRTLKFTMSKLAPPAQVIKLTRDSDYNLRFEMAPPASIAADTIEFDIFTKLGGASAINKTTAAGITKDDSGKGIITIAIDEADTAAEILSNALGNNTGYVWELAITDAGLKQVVAHGSFILLQEVITT